MGQSKPSKTVCKDKSIYVCDVEQGMLCEPCVEYRSSSKEENPCTDFGYLKSFVIKYDFPYLKKKQPPKLKLGKDFEGVCFGEKTEKEESESDDEETRNKKRWKKIGEGKNPDESDESDNDGDDEPIVMETKVCGIISKLIFFGDDDPHLKINLKISKGNREKILWFLGENEIEDMEEDEKVWGDIDFSFVIYTYSEKHEKYVEELYTSQVTKGYLKCYEIPKKAKGEKVSLNQVYISKMYDVKIYIYPTRKKQFFFSVTKPVKTWVEQGEGEGENGCEEGIEDEGEVYDYDTE